MSVCPRHLLGQAKYLSPVLLKQNLKFPLECFPEHQPMVIKIWSGVLLCSQVYVYSALQSEMPCASGNDLAWSQGTVAAQVQCHADMPSAFSTQMRISYGFVLCCVDEPAYSVSYGHAIPNFQQLLPTFSVSKYQVERRNP